MAKYLVLMECVDPNSNQQLEFIEYLESEYACAPVIDGAWVVDTSYNAEAIFGDLADYLDEDDILLVTRVSDDSYWDAPSEASSLLQG